MPQIGIVADDLTGATTTGVLLARSQAKTIAYFYAQAALDDVGREGIDAAVISTNSRALPKQQAKDIVTDATKALQQMGVQYYSKRIDTTLRGGIGYEIDAMTDLLGNDTMAVIVPAMPQSRRIVVGGYSIIDGTALINTPVAHDVRTPVTENYVPSLISAQTHHKVGLVTLSSVLKGHKSIAMALQVERDKGCRAIVVDAITIEDVEEIARACVELDWNVLAVDPGPFTSKLAYVRGLIGEERPNLPKNPPADDKTILIAAGSATPVTKKQMEILGKDERNVRISVDPQILIDDGIPARDEVNRAIEQGCILLESEKQPRSILFETALHGELLDLDQQDKDHGYTPGTSADKINVGLGIIIDRIMKRESDKVGGIYATGGDTMVNVCALLGVVKLELVDYVIPQTDLGRMIGAYDGLPIVGKGGLTGTNTSAIEIVDRLLLEAGRRVLE